MKTDEWREGHGPTKHDRRTKEEATARVALAIDYLDLAFGWAVEAQLQEVAGFYPAARLLHEDGFACIIAASEQPRRIALLFAGAWVAHQLAGVQIEGEEGWRHDY